ncbi:hypothetical protein [Streptomyces sp. enrichment culture]|uniref:hypothetical protein n=1 Tax=Streptomyces sp. enrichment culture TaxID=1795815 RepID=UPI003F55D178
MTRPDAHAEEPDLAPLAVTITDATTERGLPERDFGPSLTPSGAAWVADVALRRSAKRGSHPGRRRRAASAGPAAGLSANLVGDGEEHHPGALGRAGP